MTYGAYVREEDCHLHKFSTYEFQFLPHGEHSLSPLERPSDLCHIEKLPLFILSIRKNTCALCKVQNFLKLQQVAFKTLKILIRITEGAEKLRDLGENGRLKLKEGSNSIFNTEVRTVSICPQPRSCGRSCKHGNDFRLHKRNKCVD